jgi:hypothetical protein
MRQTGTKSYIYFAASSLFLLRGKMPLPLINIIGIPTTVVFSFMGLWPSLFAVCLGDDQ